MYDVWHKITKFVDYNRYLVTAVLLGAVLCIGFMGCQPKTPSLLDPSQEVGLREIEREVIIIDKTLAERRATIEQLEANYNSEAEAINLQIEAAQADIAEQVELRLKLIEMAGGFASVAASGGVTTPMAITGILSVVSLLANAGLGADVVRKNRVIRDSKKDHSNA